MSHVATVDVNITDLDALQAACNRLGLELRRGQQTYKWFGHSVGDYPIPQGFTAEDLGKCEHAIVVPGHEDAYDIGVIKRRDGRPGFCLQWDFFAGGYGMQDRVGENCNKLAQSYAVCAASKAAQRNGFQVQEQLRADGSIALNFSK